MAYAGDVAGTIVVGVDGSPESQAALRWAAAEAALRDARLVAVWAWTWVPPAPIAEPGMIPVPAMDYSGATDAEREVFEEELEAAFRSAFPTAPDVEIERKLVEGDAAHVLESEARDADLVVVGSRGRSGIAAALLGSVSKHVVDHAPCPVVVVKEPRDAS
jgi:nucleotide-binding universal stress UspA family protein